MKHHHHRHHRTQDDRHAQGADGYVFADALEQAGIDPRPVDETAETSTERAA
jgi:hypothetical protein